jgi:hypothetical protein
MHATSVKSGRIFPLSVALVLSFWVGSLQAQTTILPTSYYGWLDQYSMNTEHNFVGDEACVPTSSTNAMTYLQNAFPSIYGTSLTGTTYSDWHDTDNILIDQMGTTVAEGTYYDQFVYALQNYIVVQKNFVNTQFSAMFPKDMWETPYPDPTFNIDGHPTASFLSDALSEQAAVLISIEYSNGGGHELLVNGLDWDAVTGTGTLYFIDPLDPSENYNDPNPVDGPAKQTSGTLTLEGDHLKLDYLQYEGGLPNDGSPYDETSATLYGALVVAVPEPGTWSFVILGAAVLFFSRRRMRKMAGAGI